MVDLWCIPYFLHQQYWSSISKEMLSREHPSSGVGKDDRAVQEAISELIVQAAQQSSRWISRTKVLGM